MQAPGTQNAPRSVNPEPPAPGTQNAAEEENPGKPYSTGLFVFGVVVFVIGWIICSNDVTNFYLLLGLGSAIQFWVAAAIVRPIEKIYLLLHERENGRSSS